MMFKTVYYEKPGSHYYEKVDGLVYLWAFLFGTAWFAWRGLWQWAAVALLVNWWAVWFSLSMGIAPGFPYLFSCFLMAALSRTLLEASYGRAGWTRSEFTGNMG